MFSNSDDDLRVFADEAGILWPLPTRILECRAIYRIVWLLPVLPRQSLAYSRALRAAWDADHDPATLSLRTWGQRGVVITMTTETRRLAGAVGHSRRVLFELIERAGEQQPEAAVMFVAGRGSRFYELERRFA